MTLAYEGPAIAGIRKLESAIGWTVDEFLLIRSGHGRHDLLGRWPLFVRQGSLF
ncbi:hypothetical protein [Sphingomonas immobilis]|uniref:Uncharacterized protein n=1 Tax=Sphingomonas immobilis TaxID=3063997 RepID=A0ABT8ZVJ9_9SPHN|nr:hypothetical protein [Sphingomonas sp. CA1-15]MDO7841591.1 hypothetical protein [Sphingomonas sp. CA1-15]